MDREKIKGEIEAILFATSRIVKMKELITILEINGVELNNIIMEMEKDYQASSRGIEIVRIEDGFILSSKKEYHEVIFPAIDKRIKPTLSQASLEVVSIIAYNQRATRADIDAIRGVDSSASIYRLLEFGLIEQAGKADLPGKPMTYRTTDEFLKMFGMKSLNDLPELPKYKLDSNSQIVIDEIEQNNAEGEKDSNTQEKENETHAEQDDN
jgi:segregation and condensation protein B